jgi:periplasmic protein TonB
MNGWSALALTTGISGLLHAAAGSGLYGLFTQREHAPIVAELDLSMAPLVPVAPNPGGGRGKPKEAWVAPRKNQPQPPTAAPEKIETREEVQKQETNDAPCVDCSPDGTGDGGGGAGTGDGAFVPVERTSRKPRWTGNFITSRDYPAVARQEGQDGRVVLSVYLGSDGRVMDVRLLEGSYDILNQVALAKVRQAVFTPAYDRDGRAVSCKITLPIRFQLQ